MLLLSGAYLLRLVSAAALVLLGTALLRLWRYSSAAFFLGAFVVLWAAQTLSANLYTVLGREHPSLLLASQALLIPLYIPLWHFAAIFPRRLALADAAAWPALLATPAVVHLALVLAQPGTGVDPAEGLAWGWATLLLPGLTLLTGLVAAFWRCAEARLATDVPSVRRQLELATAALGVFLAYYVVAFAASAEDPVFWGRLGPAQLPYVAAATAAATAVAWKAGQLGRRGPPATWLAVFLVPAASAIVERATVPNSLTLLGPWRLVAVAILFYAVAKYRLFDLDVRLQRWTRWAVPLTAVVLAWALAAELAVLGWGIRWPDRPQEFLLVSAVGFILGGAMAPGTRRLFDRVFPKIHATKEYLLRRRAEVYLTAVAAGAPADHLDQLAVELGLRQPERVVLQRSLRPLGTNPTMKDGVLLAGRYRIGPRLAKGVYGSIAHARDERLGEAVVVKEYAGFAGVWGQDSFAREANAMGALEHPNVLPILDVFRAGDDAFIVLEHAPDGSLESRLAERGSLPVEESLAIAEQVLKGLAEAHQRGIVHRDIKPANILFSGETAKLADFGVALDPVLEHTLTSLGGQPGTLAWMAPEQARGAGASPASDVYAVGAVLYRMISGTHHIDLAQVPRDGAAAALARRRPRLPIDGVPAGLNALLARALAKAPEARFQDAKAMLRAVREARRRGAPTSRASRNRADANTTSRPSRVLPSAERNTNRHG